MTTLWLIRHGETDWNVQQRFQGISEQSLNANGETQASCLAPRLTEMSFDAIYSSDLKRVQQTARFALKYLVPLGTPWYRLKTKRSRLANSTCTFFKC